MPASTTLMTLLEVVGALGLLSMSRALADRDNVAFLLSILGVLV